MKKTSLRRDEGCRSIVFACVFLFAGLTGYSQTASFTADATAGCFPLKVKFTNTSTGSNLSFTWDFGDGNTSVLEAPETIYESPGTYTVKLTVSNGSQSNTLTRTGYITVHDNPTVQFSADQLSGCAPLSVKFKDESTAGAGAITSWFWVFGDGGTSVSANPEYIYSSPGDKSVSLRIRNQFGCENTMTKASFITANGPSNISFSASSTSVCQVPATIQFTNASSGAVTYLWDFGDGETATTKDVSHTFTKAGTYTVLLKGFDAQLCERSYSTVVSVGSGTGLDYTASSFHICQGGSVQFTLLADIPVLSKQWDLGNGTSSTTTNPSVSYPAAGSFDVTLKALLQGNTCESIVTKKIEVVALPAPSFTYKADCNGKVTFTNTSQKTSRVEWYISGNLVSTSASFTWDFSAASTRSVKLIAFNSLDCSEEITQDIILLTLPVASFLPNAAQDCSPSSLSGCAPFTLKLENKSGPEPAIRSQWKFGDGATSAVYSPQHTYSSKGEYDLTLTVTNAQGCSGSYTARVTVADTPPIAKFSVDKTRICSGSEVIFTDESQNATFWCWDFGDGTTGTGKIIRHAYDLPGIYTVRLTAKNAGCTSTYELRNVVEVLGPHISFGLSKDCADPYRVSLQNLSSNFHSFQWDFGDGATSTTDVYTHRYASTGRYELKLTGTNTTTGCTVTRIAPVFIQDIEADFELDNPTPCKEASVNFTDQSKFAVRWEWSFGSLATISARDTSFSFPDPGLNRVTLRVFDEDHCEATKSVDINVLDIQGDFSHTATSTCDVFQVKFTDLSTATPSIQSWLWDFGDGSTSGDQNPVHPYTDQGEYTVKLTLTNLLGNCTFIKSGAVVFENPVPDFFALRQNVCVDEPFTMTNTSEGAVSYTWDYGDGRSSQDIHTQVAYPAKGSYTVSLSARDSYGCTKTVSKTNYITVTKPVADFEAFDTSSDCPPLITTFKDKSEGNVTKWQWSFGDGNYSVLKDPANTYLRPGYFDVRLVATDASGCSDTTQATQLVKVGGPDGSFSTNASDICLDGTVPFQAVTTNTAIHRWDFGDGTVEDHAKETSVSHYYARPGGYTVGLILVDENGCTVVASGTEKVIVRDTAIIRLDYSPKCIFKGDRFTLSASADENDLVWEWLIEDKPAGTNPEEVVEIDSAGSYTVKLRATTSSGCVSQVSDVLPVQGKPDFIPNVFTPNGDAFNSHFVIPGLEKSSWSLRVFNRWGEPVYSSDRYTNDWDGGSLTAGVYYFYLENSFCADQNYKGLVSILK